MSAPKLSTIGLVILVLLIGCGKGTGTGDSDALSYVPENATAVAAIDVGRIFAEESVRKFLDEPMAEISQKMDTSLLSPYDVREVVIFTTEDLAALGMMGPLKMAIVVSFDKPMPLSVADSLADFPVDRRTSNGETYLANDDEQFYLCSPAEKIWFASVSESIIQEMAAGETPQPAEIDEKSAAPALMSEMTSEPDWMAAISFDISRSERPDLGPVAEMLAQDTTNPELAQLAALAPVIQQAMATINSAGFSIGRKNENYAVGLQMRFGDQETSEEIRKGLVMMLGLAGGEATKRELGFVKDIVNRVDISATKQSVSISVTISDADIEAAQKELEGI